MSLSGRRPRGRRDRDLLGLRALLGRAGQRDAYGVDFRVPWICAKQVVEERPVCDIAQKAVLVDRVAVSLKVSDAVFYQSIHRNVLFLPLFSLGREDFGDAATSVAKAVPTSKGMDIRGRPALGGE